MKITQSQLRKIIAEEIKEGFLDRFRGGDAEPPLDTRGGAAEGRARNYAREQALGAAVALEAAADTFEAEGLEELQAEVTALARSVREFYKRLRMA